MKNNILWLFALTLFVLSCSQKTSDVTQVPLEPTHPEEPSKYEEMAKEEEITDAGPLQDLIIETTSKDTLPIYHATATHVVDVEKVMLDVRFDWEKKHVLGKATLTLKPWFYPTDIVSLDAKNFDIHSIKMNGRDLKYDYDKEKLVIHLGKKYTRTKSLKLNIDYTAKPDERENIGGSAAITEDKGLYFINPDGSEAGKPKQIWTQGETESNSCWFPVVDKPNVRCLQEMYITVEDKYKTLSNGALLDSKKNANGTRTDHYQMDKPHAPYLFMLAVGEFALVKDKWKNIDLEYFVEPEYEKDARAIFKHTDDMLSFFSEKLQYPYPWQKYSQIIVRDYVSGAMENTTGVIFGDFVQMTERELLDGHLDNEKIIAHEMFHHWFGDLVTCESWSNLTLNEGFANYSEYLWFEHKHGRTEADWHLVQEHQGYIQTTSGLGHPLIDFDYNDKEDMFDAISYNKGGAILHMLRKYLGDEAFWAGLNRYLTQNEYSAVETDELRMAFEDVSGQDLNWFFNQWYFGAGMPALDISYDWNETNKKMAVTIEQTQEPTAEMTGVFNLPLKVDIYSATGQVRREDIHITKRKQTFNFGCVTKPSFVNVDAEKALLCEKRDNHSAEEWKYILQHSPLFLDRWEAINALYRDLPSEKELTASLLKDEAWPIRQLAIELVDGSDINTVQTLKRLAENDPKPGVQAAATVKLSTIEGQDFSALYERNMQNHKAYSVVGAALNAISTSNPEKAIKAAKVLENESNGEILAAVAQLYSKNPKAEHASFFDKKAQTADYMTAFGVFDAYARYLNGLGDMTITEGALNQFRIWGKDLAGQSEWRRFAATKAIADVRNMLRETGNAEKATELNTWINEIKEIETNPTLKQYYGMF